MVRIFQATPYVEEAKAFKVVTSIAKTPTEYDWDAFWEKTFGGMERIIQLDR